jgi:Tfp pilus assembly protein PilF
MGKLLLGILGVLAALAQAPDPAYAPLDRAYAALRSKNYEEAIRGFEQAQALDPERASIRKDLAYTLLKIGQTEAARDHFAEAMRLDPADDQVALEYAFLCYETKQQIIARRVFDRLRKSGNATASDAFENVDRPLREGIARWKQALELSPDNFSAHEELARLAEQRDQLDLASEQYQAAWKLRPARRDLLLDLGRVWQEQGRMEEAHAALLAASRGAEPRVAEQARELLGSRYPYVYEFEKALELDPSNDALRRELAYLHLEMGNRAAAEQQLQALPERPRDPGPQESVPQESLPQSNRPQDNKLLGEQSLDKGYLNDALKYLHAAHENDPADFEVMLKLGWAYNILKDDREAVRWFDLARQSPDAAIASEASRAYGNLIPSLRRLRTTVWAFPTVSTRWRDTFLYAQAKTELRLAFPIHPYVSLRFIGDTRGEVRMGANISPQNLSESSVIIGVGVAGPTWRGLMAWFEAGEALRYQIPPAQTGTALPDFRGGITYAHALDGSHRLFAETNDDGVFISRFDNDSLLYSQNRTGRTLRENFQVYWNWNATVDAKGEYWANTVETGPGVRFRLNPLQFTVNFMRGAYLVNQSNPYRPNFNDVRIGVWYAFTH